MLALVVAQRSGPDGHVDQRAVLSAALPLDCQENFAVAEFLHPVAVLLLLFGRNCGQRAAEHFVLAPSKNPLRARIPEGDVPLQIEHRDGQRRRIHHGFEHFGGLPLFFIRRRKLRGPLLDAGFQLRVRRAKLLSLLGEEIRGILQRRAQVRDLVAAGGRGVNRQTLRHAAGNLLQACYAAAHALGENQHGNDAAQESPHAPGEDCQPQASVCRGRARVAIHLQTFLLGLHCLQLLPQTVAGSLAGFEERKRAGGPVRVGVAPHLVHVIQTACGQRLHRRQPLQLRGAVAQQPAQVGEPIRHRLARVEVRLEEIGAPGEQIASGAGFRVAQQRDHLTDFPADLHGVLHPLVRVASLFLELKEDGHGRQQGEDRYRDRQPALGSKGQVYKN